MEQAPGHEVAARAQFFELLNGGVIRSRGIAPQMGVHAEADSLLGAVENQERIRQHEIQHG